MRKFLYIALLSVGFSALTQTPIINYQFDGTVKDSQGNIDGILVNGGTLVNDRFGEASSALSLDGTSQFLNMDNGGTAIVSTGKISFVGWFNSNDFSTTQAILNIPELVVSISDSGFPGMAPQDGVSSIPLVSSVAISKTEWFHLAATYDGVTAKIYVNGVETGSDTQNKTLSTKSGVTNLGANVNNNNVFPGLMDNVSFYDFALSSAQIFTLYQEGAFITSWETTTNNESITIPTTGSGYNYTIDWGDGTVESGQTGDATHAYASAGTYSVSIQGDFTRIYFNNGSEGQMKDKIISVNQWGDIQWSTMEFAFYGCTNLAVDAPDAPNLTNTTDLTSMFQGCTSFNQNIDHWDVSGITRMTSTFESATSFNQPLNSWSSNSLTTLNRTFETASAFDQPLSNWDVSSVDNFDRTFGNTTLFDQSLAAWDISSSGFMGFMFEASGISIGNYDATLTGWATLESGETQIPSGITLGAAGLSYCNGESARNDLITNFTWTISGDVLDCPDLLAQYALDGDAIDASDFGFDGTVFEAELTTDRFGNTNSAYVFDGEDDNISIPSTNHAPTNLTISAWFYFTEGGGDATHQIVEIDGAAFLAVSEGSFLTGLNLDGGFQVPETSVTHSEWHLGTFTYDGSFLRSYLDGVLFDERENAGPIEYANSASPINIGTSAFAGSFFNGSIDDVSVYGIALSETEISELYNDRGYINPREPLAILYSSLGGDSWNNNSNWNTEESLASWHGVTMTNGLVTGLELPSNNLVGNIPIEVADLPHLERLRWFNNSGVTGSIPIEIGNLTNLTNLSFQLCNLTGSIPTEIGNLTNLTSLVLGPNQLTGAVPASFSNLTNVITFAIHENQLSSLPDLTGMPATSLFWIQGNKFGFEELIVNQAYTSSANSNFGPQTADDEEILTVINNQEVTLTTSESAPNTNYQWYFKDEIIEGANLQDHVFTYNSSLEGEYYVVMTNGDLPDVTITRVSYLVRDEINSAPTFLSFADGTVEGILKEGLPIGTLVAVLETVDADPVDTYTYTLVAGDGDGFNSSFTISNDSVFTAVEMDPVATPSQNFRVRSTDAGAAFVENTFVILISPIQVCNDEVFTATSGSFGDGSGIFEYESNFSCNWLIELSPENQVRLSFSEFATEQDYDFVRVYDGSDATATLLGEFSGATIPESIVSSSNTLFVTFESDNVIVGAGWTANYSQLTPVADYPFTDGSLEDFSGYGNTISISTAISTSDRLGGDAYSFDGSSSYMQASSTLSGSDVPFSISAWIKWDGDNGNIQEIVSWWSEASTAKVYFGPIPSGELRFGDSYGSSGAFIPANEWVHVAATYDGSIGSIYVNGVLSSNSSTSISYDFAGGDLFIGKQGTNDIEYFDGIIDELKIYDIALSSNEISNLYTGTSTSLIAYLPFNTSFDDESSNGNTAVDLGSGNTFANDRLGVGSSAYNFDVANTSSLEISSFANYNFGDEITVMGWIRPDSYPTDDMQLFNNSFLSETGFEFRLIKGDLSANDALTKRQLFAGIWGIAFGSAGEIFLDEWTHIAFRFSRGQGTTLYINGQNLITYGFVAGTDDLPIPVSSDGIFIGEGFDGSMDEIKVFSTALTNQDILDEYEENLWPFASLAFRGPEDSGENTIDQGLALNPIDENSYLGALQLYFDGDYQFRATASNGFEAFMGDNELDGIAEPGSTQLALTEGFYAVGFKQANFQYFLEPISSVGIIGNALTGDDSGWDADIDLTDLGRGIYQIRNLTLYDGEFKLRINDAWDYIDWGSNGLDGNLDYRGNNIPIAAGTYTLSFDLHNNKYTIIDLNSNEAVADLDFNGNTLDDSGFDNNGSSTSTAYTIGRFGLENTAIVLDGTSGVNLGNDVSINLTNGFTMNLWINPTDNTGGREMFASGGSFHNHLYPTEISWRYFQNEVETGIDGIPIEAPNNTWTMITWTYDGGAMRFYDDGVLVYSETVYGELDVNANSYAIGATFIGAIDAFQWIDGVLSEKEIQYLYTDNLILDYALDGNTLDQSGNGIDGTLPNAGSYVDDRFGSASSALSLNGSDQYIEVDNANESLITGNEITFEGWFKASNLTGGAFLLSSPGIIAVIDDSGFATFATQSTEASTFTTSNVAINLDEWFHFAGTYDGSTAKVYINGIETASNQTNEIMNIAAGGSTTIGGNGSSNLAGFLDDVSVYNHALSAEEIAALYGQNDFASPVISGIFPASGAPGTNIRVYGKNLALAGAAVSFGETTVTPTSIADNVLYFDVPDISSGRAELLVSNDFDASLPYDFTVLNSNTSSISFGSENAIPSLSTTPFDMITGDFNGDGFIDLIVTTFDDGIAQYMENDGTNSFPSVRTIYDGTDNIISTVISGDFDKDGDQDLGIHVASDFLIFTNDGAGVFDAGTLIKSGSNFRQIVTGDINGNGYLDLVLIENGILRWYSNNREGLFTDEGTISAALSTQVLNLNDFDNDGDFDIANAYNANSVLFNQGSGVFSEISLTTPTNGSDAIASGDFNGDGFIDLIAATDNPNNEVNLYLNNGAGGFNEPIEINNETFVSPTYIELGDFDGDGDLDAIIAYRNSGSVVLLDNDGSGSFTQNEIVTGQSQVSRLSAVDMDDDGDLDFFLSSQSGNIAWFENQVPSDRKEILSYDLSSGASPSEADYTLVGAFEGSRYYVSTASDTWTNAKSIAESLGGYLAAIHSQEENDFLRNAVGAVWVGGTDQNAEGQYKWADGTPLDYTNWGSTEPNGGEAENHIEFGGDGLWNDLDNTERQFVVEIPLYQGVIDEVNSTISVEVPFGTDVSSLIANFTPSEGAFAETNEIVQESGITVNDFISPVDYLVTAEDQTFKNWSVSVTINDGVLAFYPFNDNTSDESENGIDLSLEGAVSNDDRLGNPNSAYIFDGIDDQLTRTDIDLLGGEYEMSIVFWANPSRNDAFQDLVNFGNIRAFSNESGRLKFQLFTAGSSGTYDAGLEIGVWQQFVLTYDKDSIRVYKDAVLTDQVETYGAIDSNGLLISIGSSGGNDFYQGGLDDVQLFNRALSETEIQTLYNEGGWPLLNTSTDILAFDVTGERSKNIDDANHIVDIIVDFSTDLTLLTPSFNLSEGAIAVVNSELQESAVSTNDFINPVTYSITAEDNTTIQDWIVTIELDSVQGDSLALVALYNATDGDNWTTSWDLNSTMNNWEGVSVDALSKRVHSVQLDNNNLVGSMPVEIGNLTHLIGLSLDENQLGGDIPTSIGNLENLQSLSLEYNQLEGSIPVGIGNLEKLSNLFLAVNNLSGAIPAAIGNMSSLFNVRLNNNSLSGSIPSSIGNLDNLNSLFLHSNSLMGSIPSELGDIVGLRLLYLSQNALSGTIPLELGSLTNLQDLWLQDNDLSGSIPSGLGNMIELDRLFLYGNNLFGSIPSELGNLINLTELGLQRNDLNGSIPTELGNLSNATSIDLGNNKLTGAIPSSFSGLTSIIELGLDNNQLDDLPDLSGLPLSGEGLSVNSNKIGFSDIIANISITNFSYDPQIVQDTIRDLISGTYSMSTIEETSGTNYQWNKDGSDITDANAVTYEATEPGTYTVIMTNTNVPDLTITRAPYILTGDAETEIIAFSFDGIESIEDINDGIIDIEVPFTSPSLSSLVAIFGLSPGASASIGVTPQTSGVDANDFSGIVTYTVIAQDGNTTQNWVVNTSIGPNTANDIENFDIADMVGDEVINTNTHTVSIIMPYNTDRSVLTPFISMSENASIEPNTDVIQNFSNLFTYTVTSESGLAQDWIISVTNQKNNETDILGFVIPNQTVDEVINNDDHAVAINMPFGTDVTSLTPAITLSAGATINPKSGVSQNFSNSVVYTVIPEDNSASQQWTVIVTVDPNPNSLPTALSLDNSSIEENNTGIVGFFSTADADATDTHVYSLINGIGATDNSKFSIPSNGNGLSSLESFDFETKNTYSILVRTDDQRGGILDQQLTISVTDINETPTISDQTFTIDENTISGFVGDVVADDVDANTTLTFSITSGGTAFDISSTGSIIVNDGNQLDFEATPTFALTINVFDGALSNEATITVNLNNINEAPIVEDQSFSIDENTSNGTLVGTVDAFDPDNNLSDFTITGSAFDINSSGEITVSDVLQLDYETNPSFSLTVEVSDDQSLSDEATIVITLNDVLENVAPTDITFTPDNINENASIGSIVGILSSTDPNGTDDTHTYTLISGDISNFEIVSNELRNTAVLDFEAQSNYVMTVRSTDQDNASYDEELTIEIMNINEATGITLTGSNVIEYEKESGGFTISATITDEDGFLRREIFYKKITESNYSSNDLEGEGGDVFIFNFSDSNLDNVGMEYYIETEDILNDIQQSAVRAVSTKVAADALDISSSITPGTSVSNYSILAFPFESVNVSNVFSDLGTYKESWRLIRYTNGLYQDVQSGTLSPGVGYWFITKETGSLNTGGKSVTIDDGVYRINLNPSGGVDGGNGYTLIGNPFQGTLNWGDVVQHNIDEGIITSDQVQNSVIGYNGQFTNQSSLDAFEGGFIQSTESISNFEIPVSAIISGGGRLDKEVNHPSEIFIDNPEWRFDLFFKTPSYQYSIGGVGLSNYAKDERDINDIGILPRLELYLDLLFEDGSTRSIKKTADFKSWSFNIRNNLPEELIDMTWDIPVSFSKTIILVDAASQRIYDLKETESIKLSNNSSSNHQLFYGSKEAIFENLDLDFDAYFGAYPNPVKDVMTIEMFGSSEREVSISLLGLDGKSFPMGSMMLFEGLNEEMLNLEEYLIPDGVYFLKVDDKVVTKILKR